MNKQYSLVETKAVDGGDRTIEFTATQEVVDYDGDLIKVEGMNIKNIKKNKSFLWSHQHMALPIGKILSLTKTGNTIVGKAQLTSEDENAFGYNVYKLIKGGYINNVSISFLPNYDSIEYKEVSGKRVRVIKEATMLEISAVNIGANSSALITGKSLKDATEKAWQDDILDGLQLNALNEKIEELETAAQEELEVKTAKQTIKDLENELLTLKAYVKELEVQIKDQEMDENEEKCIYSEILTILKSGPQVSATEALTDELTDNEGMSIDEINKMFEDKI